MTNAQWHVREKAKIKRTKIYAKAGAPILLYAKLDNYDLKLRQYQTSRLQPAGTWKLEIIDTGTATMYSWPYSLFLKTKKIYMPQMSAEEATAAAEAVAATAIALGEL